MKRPIHDYRIRCFIGVGILALMLLPFSVPAQAFDSPGLIIELYTDQASQNYTLGDPIKLIMVIKNVANEAVVTLKGFSQKELQRALVVTDPAGKRYFLSTDPEVHQMPPPFFWKGVPWALAENLAPAYVKSVTVLDLGSQDLFPMMKTHPGRYTIEAEQPFTRFAQTARHYKLGTLGRLDDPNKWTDPIKSGKLQILITPGQSANLGVRVLDGSSPPDNALGQVPVKVFEGQVSVEELAGQWETGEPVLEGITDFQGWAVWNPSYSQCKQQGVYTAVAGYQGGYRHAFFTGVDGEGWAPDCTGEVKREIFFFKSFSIFALNSVVVRSKAVIQSGNVGAKAAGQEPWPEEKAEISFDPNAETGDRVQIYGDSIVIKPGASVCDVFYNDLENKGTIRGQEYTPLTLPVWQEPEFRESVPGQEDVTVSTKGVKVLDLQTYGDVRIRTKGALRLNGGVYHFKSLDMGQGTFLICQGSSEIRIKERLSQGQGAYLGPSSDSGLGARDVVIYVGGIDGKTGKSDEDQKAAVIGVDNTIKANIYAPNGTLWIGQKSHVEGSFMARDVIVGQKVEVRLDSSF